MATYNVKNILECPHLQPIKFFTFTKDDVKNKKAEVPNGLPEVTGTGKCHEVLIDPA